MQWHTQFFISAQQFRVDLIEALWAVGLALGCRVIADFLEIHRRKVHMRPFRRCHFKPFAIRGKPPFEQELRLLLDCGKLAYCLFVQTRRESDRFDIGHKTRRILPIQEGVDGVGCATAHSEKLHVEGHAAVTLAGGFDWDRRPGTNSMVALGVTMSATETCSSVLRTIALMRCQLLRILQSASTLQVPGVAVHSVKPNGWSSKASIMSAMLISSAALPRA